MTLKNIKWGWDNKIEILSWPSFYSKVKLNRNLLNNEDIYIPLTKI